MKSLSACLLTLLILIHQPSPGTAASKIERILLLARRTDTSPHAVYNLALDANGHIAKSTLLAASEGYTLVSRTPDALDFARYPDEPLLRILVNTGERLILTSTPTSPAADPTRTWTAQILAQVTPLSGPRDFHPLPNDPTSVIFSMTGPADNYLNLYWLDAVGEVHPLTSVESRANETLPLLSASAEFLNWRPVESPQFLYRARQRDAQGQAVNTLHLYSLEDFSATPAPYFGKTPVWSADGQWLAGVRLNDTIPPLYILWRIEWASGQVIEIGPGCNPAWSASGEWLAFDGHDNSQWQGYTDCYANGRVYAQNTVSGQIIELSAGISGFVQGIGWMGG